MAVEEREHTAGKVRLEVLQGVSFDRDPRPFICDVDDAPEITLRTDGYGA